MFSPLLDNQSLYPFITTLSHSVRIFVPPSPQPRFNLTFVLTIASSWLQLHVRSHHHLSLTSTSLRSHNRITLPWLQARCRRYFQATWQTKHVAHSIACGRTRVPSPFLHHRRPARRARRVFLVTIKQRASQDQDPLCPPAHAAMADDDNDKLLPPPPAVDAQPPGRIIDRKISPSGRSVFACGRGQARRGGESGADANSSRSSGAKPPSSVRAIVTWLESSSNTTTGGGSAGGGPGRLTPPSAWTQTSSTTPVRPAPLVANADHDSLTLLKYKSYFNNRPLGRCLDDPGPAPAETAVSPLSGPIVTLLSGGDSRQDVRTNNPLEEKGEQKEKENSEAEAEETAPAAAVQGPKRSTSLQRLDELMDELEDLVSAPPPTPPERLAPRPPQEVRQFWDGVRRYLYISDEELEGCSSAAAASVPLRTAATTSSVADSSYHSIVSVSSMPTESFPQLQSSPLQPSDGEGCLTASAATTPCSAGSRKHAATGGTNASVSSVASRRIRP